MACCPKIVQGATGWGGMGEDDNNGGLSIRNYARQSINGKGQDQEHQKWQIDGGGCAIGRLIQTEISAANAQDGQSPPPNPTPVYLTCINHFILLYALILRALLSLFRRQLQQNAIVTNLTILQSSEMGPMLATEGELDQIAAHTVS